MKTKITLLLLCVTMFLNAQTQRTRAYFNALWVPGHVLTSGEMADQNASVIFILSDSIASSGDTMLLKHQFVKMKKAFLSNGTQVAIGTSVISDTLTVKGSTVINAGNSSLAVESGNVFLGVGTTGVSLFDDTEVDLFWNGINGAIMNSGGSHIYGVLTQGVSLDTVPHFINKTATLNFGSTLTLASTDLTISVTGAVLGDLVILGVPNASTLSNGVFTAWVSASNTVKVRFTNTSAGSLDPASGLFRVSVGHP